MFQVISANPGSVPVCSGVFSWGWEQLLSDRCVGGGAGILSRSIFFLGYLSQRYLFQRFFFNSGAGGNPAIPEFR